MRPLPFRSYLLLALLFQVIVASSLQAADEIIVVSYNLENYLGPVSKEEAAARRTRPKSESAIDAIVRIVTEIHPDVLGLCEMGNEAELASFRARLVAAGQNFTESELVLAPDPDRHLALLSKFPIVERHSQPDVSYDLNGAPEKMKRGILDVTLQINPSYSLRLVGVHLKSKLETGGNEALVRRHEAQLVREHMEMILTKSPDSNLLLYGDFNDLRNEPAVQELIGPRGSSMHLTDLPLKDVQGDRWTQYWKPADLYSRIDYFFASSGLLHEIVSAHSGIYRSDFWNDASDHRPIYTAIHPIDKR